MQIRYKFNPDGRAVRRLRLGGRVVGGWPLGFGVAAGPPRRDRVRIAAGLRGWLRSRAHRYRPRIFAMISRMTSSAPPPMRMSRVSRHARWIGRSIRYDAPPKICIALFETRLQTRPV
jgi:hypothetical protein